jgi:hypothetical protein
VVEYYRAIGHRPDAYAAHTRFVSVDDTSARSLADKLLDRPELIAGLGDLSGDRPVLIEPWNVTASEVAVAEHLQAPINGMDPALRHLGFKSTGRRLFAEAGVPVPYGWEYIRTVDEVVAAVEMIQRARPLATSVVIKHDDSGAGDGNVVLPRTERRTVRRRRNPPPGRRAAWVVCG